MTRDAYPAAALLIDAGGRSLRAAAGVGGPAADERDWLALPDAAERHGMSAWVHQAIAAWPDAPASIRERVAETSRQQRLRALRGVAELACVARLLHDAGIASVSLKGPLFSRWLYGDVGMRRFADLDLLIRIKDRERALGILCPAGYSLPAGMSVATARTVFAGTGAWPLVHERAFGIDLHWAPQAARFGSAFDIGEVLRESTSAAVGGDGIRIPSPTHAATLALLHAAKHTWSSLELVLSIAHLMRRADVGWSQVHHLSARAGAWTGSAAGLALARDVFGVDVPLDVRAGVERRPVRPLVEAALTFLAMADVEGASRRDEFSVHCAALDSTRRRIAYAAWRLLAPTPLEAAWCRLPDRFVALYVPARIVRLASDAVLGRMALVTRTPPRTAP